MNEGEFTRNFTWFEWSFVSPDQLPAEEPMMAAEGASSPFRSQAGPFEQRGDVWDEDTRWTT